MNDIKQTPAPNATRNIRVSRLVVIFSIVWIVLWYFLIIDLDLTGNIRAFVEQYSNSDYEQTRNISNLLTSLPFILGAFGISTGISLLINNKILKIIAILAGGIMVSFFTVGIGTFLNFAINN